MDGEYAVIGGGVVGLSVAYGLIGLGKKVTVFDEGDGAFRASRGNFGLVWVQSKGLEQPAYARWTRKSAKAWSGFADELGQASGESLALRQDGGYGMYMSEESLADTVAKYEKLKAELGGDYPYEVLGHNALKQEEPNIGPKVAGAILHREDGHVNPLKLLRSLASEVRRRGGDVRIMTPVAAVEPIPDGFRIRTGNGAESRFRHVVLCAGLGALALGRDLGFEVPIRPQRGQVLITEKTEPIVGRPTDTIRQVDEGGVQIGASKEEAGLDDRETLETTAGLASAAIDIFPCLADVNLVRSWAALRIMSPDGIPVYQQSRRHPGAYFVTCHSGITLAAAHARYLPLWITGQADAPDLSAFSEERFGVQTA